ncbi:MAG: hypothetical protein KKC55_15725 [Gammaproteobacteria bacterium]|nr:hypothetical protein [Gammaproteobacteria bacterium]
MAWTVFEYLYRDADNHKAFGKVALEGVGADADWSAALKKLDEELYFVAEQVGLPPLYDRLYRWSENAPTDSDHYWHEFIAISVLDESILPTDISPVGTTEAFLDRLMGVGSWNIRPS